MQFELGPLWVGVGSSINPIYSNLTDNWVEYTTTTAVFTVDTPVIPTIRFGWGSGEIWVDNVQWFVASE